MAYLVVGITQTKASVVSQAGNRRSADIPLKNTEELGPQETRT